MIKLRERRKGKWWVSALLVMVWGLWTVLDFALAQKATVKNSEKSKAGQSPSRSPLILQPQKETSVPGLQREAVPPAPSEILQRVSRAHGKEQMSRTDTVAEGTVKVYSDGRPKELKVTLVHNAEHQSQRILLQQADGKMWDGHADHLTPEGKRVLEFLETQFRRGQRQLLSPPVDGRFAVRGMAASTRVLTLQEQTGQTTQYFVDEATSRLAHFDFEQGQSRDNNGRVAPKLHSYAYQDYRSDNGIATPFRIEHATNGVKQEELQLTRVRYSAVSNSARQ